MVIKKLNVRDCKDLGNAIDLRKESAIERDILIWLAAQRIFAWKVKTVGTYDPARQRFRKTCPWYRKGVWDIHGFIKGRPFIIEVKSATGQLSKLQKEFQQDWSKASGGIYFVARSIDDVEEAFAKI